MKSSLTKILCDQVVGKKIAKQCGIFENYWGATIIDAYPCRDPYCEDHAVYVIVVDVKGNNTFVIDTDFELELI